jgi:hypothetical protein
MIEISRKVSRKGFLGDLIVEDADPLAHTIFEFIKVRINFSEFSGEITKIHYYVLLLEGYNRYTLRKLGSFCLLRFFLGLLDCLFL